MRLLAWQGHYFVRKYRLTADQFIGGIRVPKTGAVGARRMAEDRHSALSVRLAAPREEQLKL
jgi:hypothetical protein